MRIILFLFIVLLSLSFIIPKVGENIPVIGNLTPPNQDFSKVDAYARASSPKDEKSIDSLSSYLLKGASSDIQKVRTIYIWLTDNIIYNADAYNTRIYPNQDAENILKSRKAVCEGFSNLFLELSKKMNLEAHKISGFAKGYSFSSQKFNYSKSNHAWNIVKIEGKWKLFDATWGAGYGKQVGNVVKNVKEFDDFWFDTPPYSFFFTHYPEEQKWTLLNSQFDLSRFKKLPYIQEPFFKFGFDEKKVIDLWLKNSQLELVDTFNVINKIQVEDVPLKKRLTVNRNYRFKIFAPENKKMALIEKNGNNWIFFKKEGDFFVLNYHPFKKGIANVSLKNNNNDTSYDTLLRYKIGK